MNAQQYDFDLGQWVLPTPALDEEPSGVSPASEEFSDWLPLFLWKQWE